MAGREDPTPPATRRGSVSSRLAARAALVMLALAGSGLTLAELLAVNGQEPPAQLDPSFGVGGVSYYDPDGNVTLTLVDGARLADGNYVVMAKQDDLFLWGVVDSSGAFTMPIGYPNASVDVRSVDRGPNYVSYCGVDENLDTAIGCQLENGSLDQFGCNDGDALVTLDLGADEACNDQFWESGAGVFYSAGFVNDDAVIIQFNPATGSFQGVNFTFATLGSAEFTTLTLSADAIYVGGSAGGHSIVCKVWRSSFTVDTAWGNANGCNKVAGDGETVRVVRGITIDPNGDPVTVEEAVVVTTGRTELVHYDSGTGSRSVVLELESTDAELFNAGKRFVDEAYPWQVPGDIAIVASELPELPIGTSLQFFAIGEFDFTGVEGELPLEPGGGVRDIESWFADDDDPATGPDLMVLLAGNTADQEQLFVVRTISAGPSSLLSRVDFESGCSPFVAVGGAGTSCP